MLIVPGGQEGGGGGATWGRTHLPRTSVVPRGQTSFGATFLGRTGFGCFGRAGVTLGAGMAIVTQSESFPGLVSR